MANHEHITHDELERRLFEFAKLIIDRIKSGHATLVSMIQGLQSQIDSLNQTEKRIMSQVQVDSAQIDALTTAVASLSTITTQLQADNTALVGLVQSVEQQLAAAIAANQPLPVADLTNTLQTIQGVVSSLTATDAADTAITSAQTATTAVAASPAVPATAPAAPAPSPVSSTTTAPVIPVVDLNPAQGATADPNTGMIQGVHPTVTEDGTVTGTGTAPNAGDPTGETSPVPASAPTGP